MNGQRYTVVLPPKMNTATKEVIDAAVFLYSSISGDYTSEDITVKEVQDFLLEEANAWLSCEPMYTMPDDSEELWPTWVTLVATENIASRIDWVAVRDAVAQDWDKHLSDLQKESN